MLCAACARPSSQKRRLARLPPKRSSAIRGSLRRDHSNAGFSIDSGLSKKGDSPMRTHRPVFAPALVIALSLCSAALYAQPRPQVSPTATPSGEKASDPEKDKGRDRKPDEKPPQPEKPPSVTHHEIKV